MKTKLILCVVSLITAVMLLNSGNSLYIEAGKAVMVLSILGFYAVAQLQQVIEEEDFFDNTIEKKMPKSEQAKMSNQRVA